MRLMKSRRWTLPAAFALLMTTLSAAATAPPLTLSALTIQGPLPATELEAAFAGYAGRPLDDHLREDVEALVRDYYDWMEWQEVSVRVEPNEQQPDVLRVVVEASPPPALTAPAPSIPEVVASTAAKPKRAGRSKTLPASYEDWLHSGARVLVVAGERRLYLKHRGEVLSFTVAVGTERTPTPPGEYRVQAISHKPTWYPTRSIRQDHAARGIRLPAVVPPGPGNPLGDWFVRLQDSIGIHGTDAPDSIGQASSWGCIRMRDEDIDRVARLLRRGDRIVVLDGLPQQLTQRH